MKPARALLALFFSACAGSPAEPSAAPAGTSSVADSCAVARPDFGGVATEAARTLFAYDANAPLNLQKTVESTSNGVEVSAVSFSSPGGGSVTGLLFDPVKDLQRAVDVLRARANVDDERIAYVGVSYGGAMGALFVGIERRIKAAVLVVGDGGLVSHFTGPEDSSFMASLSCATRVDWFRAMAPIEPIRFIAHASPTALLLQNGRLDNLVPEADAEELHAAAPQPRTIRWYAAGHGLNQQALWDRHDWLQEQVGLDARQ